MTRTITPVITPACNGDEQHGDTEQVSADAAASYEAPEEGFEPPTRRLTVTSAPEGDASAHPANVGHGTPEKATESHPTLTPASTRAAILAKLQRQRWVKRTVEVMYGREWKNDAGDTVVEQAEDALSKVSLANLVSVKQAAEAVAVDADRLAAYADLELCPHFRIDGGEPLFQVPALRRWVKDNLLTFNTGAPLSDRIVLMPSIPAHDIEPAGRIPQVIAHLRGLLVLTVGLPAPCGLYFLCLGSCVVYVGQSVAPLARVGQHLSDGKQFDRVYLLPVLPEYLDESERAFIRVLQPPLNVAERKCAPTDAHVEFVSGGAFCREGVA